MLLSFNLIFKPPSSPPENNHLQTIIQHSIHKSKIVFSVIIVVISFMVLKELL